MKFYRVSYSQEGGNSAGFSWHRTRREALAAARKDYNQDPAEYDNNDRAIEERIEAIDVVPTKAGILKAMHRYASHPDNG
jgi:hypothetical protein